MYTASMAETGGSIRENWIVGVAIISSIYTTVAHTTHD